jgi:hypothetical protein
MQPQFSFDLILDHFGLTDLKIVCYRLGLRYDDLAGDVLSEKVLSLHESSVKNQRLFPLFRELIRQRPHLRQDVALCLHEFIFERFDTEQKLTNLFIALSITSILDFRGPERGSWGQSEWRADKAKKLQSEMAEKGQWDHLLQVVAEQTDEYITLEQLQEVFGRETPTAVSSSSLSQPTFVAERPFPFEPFLHLNFSSQVFTYRQHHHEPIAAFVVLGLPQTELKPSLRLLLKRLLAWTTTETAISRITLDVDYFSNDPDIIWWQVASEVGLGKAGFGFPLRDEDWRKIAQGVYNRLKTQHVIFIFEGLCETQIELLINHFWQKLVAEVKALQLNSASGRKLFAFFVDNRGRLSEDAFKALIMPSLVILPPVPLVSHHDLADWVNDVPIMSACDPRMRDFVRKPQVEDLVLAQSDDGIPDKVLRYVCAQCGYDFYGEFSNWLKS